MESDDNRKVFKYIKLYKLMEDYEITTIKELTDRIKSEGCESVKGKRCELSGIARGVALGEGIANSSSITSMLDDQTGNFAIINYHPNSIMANKLTSILKTSGETNKNVNIKGTLQVCGIDKDSPQIDIIANEVGFGNYKERM